MAQHMWNVAHKQKPVAFENPIHSLHPFPSFSAPLTSYTVKTFHKYDLLHKVDVQPIHIDLKII